MISESQKNFDDVKKSFNQGRLIPFVGAGFSMIDPKAPDWHGIIHDIAKDINLEDDLVLKDLSDNLEQAEYLQKVLEKKGVAKRAAIKRIEQTLVSTLEVLPSKELELIPHRIILENFDRIYTTNYDVYFETAADRIGIKIQKVPPVEGEILPNTPLQHPYITRNTNQWC